MSCPQEVSASDVLDTQQSRQLADFHMAVINSQNPSSLNCGRERQLFQGADACEFGPLLGPSLHQTLAGVFHSVKMARWSPREKTFLCRGRETSGYAARKR
jgi:hypothetical protein